MIRGWTIHPLPSVAVAPCCPAADCWKKEINELPRSPNKTPIICAGVAQFVTQDCACLIPLDAASPPWIDTRSKKNRPLLILGEKKKKERGKGKKKRVLLAQNSVVYEHVTRVGGCSLDVKGWRESSRKLAVSCSSLQGLESGFGYVFGYFITLLRYDCFLFRRKKNFRQSLDTLHPLGGVSSRIVIN